jgi:hypothetical protein
MVDLKRYRAFFSYAHHDAETDPPLIRQFTTALEMRVNAKLANARFDIWHDKEGLRTGDKWNEEIEREVRGSDVLIVLLTPRWVESDYCRKEYSIFEEIEARRNIGEYVVPILARAIERQEKHFTIEQKDVYERIKSRQYQKAISIDFLKLRSAERTELLDKIADDVEGIIDRLRTLPAPTAPIKNSPIRIGKIREFDAAAQNYEKVDFVADSEIVLDQPNQDGQRDILAQIGFVERLYVQGKRGRIEFGVRRAFLSVRIDGPGTLSRIDEFRGGPEGKSVYYTILHEAPDAITVCMDPPDGRSSLSALPLPPAENENLLSKVGIASANIGASQLKAELIVSLNVEGLYLVDHNQSMSPRTAAAIKAIMDVARAKTATAENQKIDHSGQFRRTISVRER